MPTAKPAIQAYRAINDEILTGDWNVQALQAARWEQESLAGTGQDPIAPLALAYLPQSGRNLLTNGGFDLYQRGVGPDTAAVGAGPHIVADGWAHQNSTATKEATVTDGSAASLRIDTLDLVNVAIVNQQAFNLERFRGAPLTLTGRVYAPAGGSAYLALADGTNSATGDALGVGGGWTTLSVTLPVLSAGATSVNAIFFSFGPGTFYLDNFMLTPTAGRVAYVPLDPTLALFRAERRFAVREFSLRFRAEAVVAPHDYTLPYRGGIMTDPPAFAPSFSLAGTAGVDYNNIGAVAIPSYGADSLVLRVTPAAPSTVTFLFKQSVTIDSGDY